jgi:hypothetical protein
MTRSRSTLTIVVVVVLTVSIVAAARADTRSIHDPKGDSHKGQPDLQGASVDHTPHGRLRHFAFAYNTFATNKAPCLHIQTKHRNQDDFIICSDGKISHVASKGQPGTAKVRRPTDYSIGYIFTKKSIGNPSEYRWKWSVDAFATCGGPCDVAPNTGYITHKL